jgi:hypothetical protein
MTEFLKSADTRETSTEIIEAIWTVSGRNETVANRIWDAPESGELVAIWEIVTKNGLIDECTFVWGASGNQWNHALQN